MFVIWCIVLAVVLDAFLKDLSLWPRRLVIGVICLLVWTPAAHTLSLSHDGNSVRYLIGVDNLRRYLAAHHTTMWETKQALAKVSNIRSLLLINQNAAYRWPGKVMT